MEDLRRQFRISLFALLTIIPIGIIGFILIEGWSLIEATYVTIVTLSTVGYGDSVPKSDNGRIFTIFLLIIGIGTFAYTAQTFITMMTSPLIREITQRRRTLKKIKRLNHHYIICGEGALVDRIIIELLQSAQSTRNRQRERFYRPIDRVLDRIFGDDDEGHALRVHKIARRISHLFAHIIQPQDTILDILLVITEDEAYADHLREADLLVLEGSPTEDATLLAAGIERAQAMMIVSESDAETLLTVLTARNLRPNLSITAAALDERIALKLTRVGAQSVVTPYDVAGQFLNNATLRPAVNDFFHSLIFDYQTRQHVQPIPLYDDSPWIGQTLGALRFRERYDAAVMAVSLGDGHFVYVPPDDFRLEEDQSVLIIAEEDALQQLQAEAHPKRPKRHQQTLQMLPAPVPPHKSTVPMSADEAEQRVQSLAQHFVICGSNYLARHAVNNLDPERPFVIISDDDTWSEALLQRGFRVIRGIISAEETLMRAGVDRAQGLMVSHDDKAETVLTILNSRALSKKLLITATATSDDMISKLARTGADRVISPYHIAARFILMSTLRYEVSAFLHYVIFNEQVGLETTELYMEEASPWIGQTLSALQLDERYQARVIGIRSGDADDFVYAPPPETTIREHDVLIIITPMQHAEALRAFGYGDSHKRPVTLRRRSTVIQSSKWSREMIRQLLEDAEGEV